MDDERTEHGAHTFQFGVLCNKHIQLKDMSVKIGGVPALFYFRLASASFFYMQA